MNAAAYQVDDIVGCLCGSEIVKKQIIGIIKLIKMQIIGIYVFDCVPNVYRTQKVDLFEDNVFLNKVQIFGGKRALKNFNENLS